MDTFTTAEAILLLIANAIALVMGAALVSKLWDNIPRKSLAPLPVIDLPRDGLKHVD